MLDYVEYWKLLVALIAIVDVPGNIPMFLQQTHEMSQRDKTIAAVAAGVVTAVLLLAFAFFGKAVLASFGITIEAFKILGGLVILLIALQMLGFLPEGSSGSGKEIRRNPYAIGVFPMAVPLFAGPGAISMVMVYAHKDFHSSHDLIVSVLIGSTALIIVAGLSVAVLLSRLIGPVAQNVLNRVLGMIVGALGVEFILEGVVASFAAVNAVR